MTKLLRQDGAQPVLDHASLRVAELGPALEAFTRWFGYAPERTQGASHHARLFVDGAYLELREERANPPGLALWFLRYSEAGATSTAMHDRGFPLSPVREYVGVDGVWEELHLESPPSPEAAALAPILVKRLLPPAIAARWPPPPGRHPFGALSLEAVLLETPEPRAAEWLGALAPGAARVKRVEGRPPRCAGLLFAAEDFDGLVSHLGSAAVESRPAGPAQRRELWVAEAERFGLQLGFVATEAAG